MSVFNHLNDYSTLANKYNLLVSLEHDLKNMQRLSTESDAGASIQYSQIEEIESVVDEIIYDTDIEKEQILKVHRDENEVPLTMSFEADKNMISKFIDALLDKLRTIKEAIAKWVHKLTDKHNRHIVFIKDMKLKLNDLYVEEKALKTVSVTSNKHMYSIRDTIVRNFDDLTKQFRRHEEIRKFITEDQVEIYKVLFSKMDALLADGKEGFNKFMEEIEMRSYHEKSPVPQDIKEMNKLISSNINKMSSLSTGAFKSDSKDPDVMTLNSANLLGSMSLSYTRRSFTDNPDEPNNLHSAYRSLNAFDISIRKVSHEQKKDYEYIEFERFSKEQCTRILDELLAISKFGSDKSEKLRSGYLNSAFAGYEKALQASKRSNIANDEKDKVDERRKIENDLLNIYSHWIRDFQDCPISLLDYTSRFVEVILNLVLQHIKDPDMEKAAV